MEDVEFQRRARKRIKEVKRKARPGEIKISHNLTPFFFTHLIDKLF